MTTQTLPPRKWRALFFAELLLAAWCAFAYWFPSKPPAWFGVPLMWYGTVVVLAGLWHIYRSGALARGLTLRQAADRLTMMDAGDWAVWMFVVTVIFKL